MPSIIFSSDRRDLRARKSTWRRLSADRAAWTYVRY